MENQKLLAASSPHVRSDVTVPKIMFGVVLALLPATFASVYFFGWPALSLIMLCTGTAILVEALLQQVRGKQITVWDGSAIITGLLLALNLPPHLPPWIAVLGTVVAIILGKQLFGGLGHNPFNPALVGRAFLVAAFPVFMTTWTLPRGIDAISSATALNLAKFEGIQGFSYWELFIGRVPGSLGETSALALLIGGAYLIYKQYADWRIPLSYLGTVAIMALLTGRDPLFHLLAGGLMIGAIYMATDMVTNPITAKGRWIFGIGAGLITAMIRFWGGYPGGVTFAILFMNAVTPLLNRVTRPRIYGR